jgi:hypothetical protein
MKKQLLGLLFLSICYVTGHAQTNDLSQDELSAFKVQCQERVDAFQMGLEIIADKKQPAEIKDHYSKTLPEMFLGNGDPWSDANGGRHPAVKMQIARLKQGVLTTEDRKLKEYLNNLRYSKLTSIVVKKAKTCMISNLYKISDNQYMGTCTFFQYFTAYSGESVVINDHTQKDVDVYISRVDDGGLGSYWEMKFGDINVSEVTNL